MRELADALRAERGELHFLEKLRDPAGRVGHPEKIGEQGEVFAAVIQVHTPRGCFSGTTPILRRRSRRRGAERSPNSQMSPDVGRVMPRSIMMVEVFPEPLGPRKP